MKYYLLVLITILVFSSISIVFSGCAFGRFTDNGGWIVGVGELEKGDNKIKCGINVGAIPRD